MSVSDPKHHNATRAGTRRRSADLRRLLARCPEHLFSTDGLDLHGRAPVSTNR